MLIIGIDISKAKFDAAVWVEERGEKLGNYANDQDGFDELHKVIQEMEQEKEQVKLIMEPTGGYELKLVFYAIEQGWLISLPNPKLVKDWAKGSGWRAKTDSQDALKLAQYGVEKKPPLYQPMPEVTQQLHDLLKRQEELRKMLRSERNRLGQYQTRPRRDDWVLNSLESMIGSIEAQLQSLQDEVKQLFQQHTDLKTIRTRLLTVPGVGPQLVNHLLVLFTHWSMHTAGTVTGKQLVAFVGLDPQPFESGQSVFKRPTISKMGNKMMRHKLYMSALGGVRGHTVLQQFYQRLVGRGKAKKLALVASARKILVWAWAVFINEVDFDEAKASPKS